MKQHCILMAALALAGCSTTPNYDAHFGESVRQARLAMTVNPNGTPDSDKAAGMDGKAAKEAMERYYDTFKAPPPVVNVINIGGPAGSAK